MELHIILYSHKIIVELCKRSTTLRTPNFWSLLTSGRLCRDCFVLKKFGFKNGRLYRQVWSLLKLHCICVSGIWGNAWFSQLLRQYRNFFNYLRISGNAWFPATFILKIICRYSWLRLVLNSTLISFRTLIRPFVKRISWKLHYRNRWTRRNKLTWTTG